MFSIVARNWPKQRISSITFPSSNPNPKWNLRFPLLASWRILFPLPASNTFREFPGFFPRLRCLLGLASKMNGPLLTSADPSTPFFRDKPANRLMIWCVADLMLFLASSWRFILLGEDLCNGAFPRLGFDSTTGLAIVFFAAAWSFILLGEDFCTGTFPRLGFDSATGLPIVLFAATWSFVSVFCSCTVNGFPVRFSETFVFSMRFPFDCTTCFLPWSCDTELLPFMHPFAQRELGSLTSQTWTRQCIKT